MFIRRNRAGRLPAILTLMCAAAATAFGADTTALAGDMVRGGLRARLTCVDPRVLDRRFAGREFDAELLAELPAAIDPCGERGEFHTFAYDGSDFKLKFD